MEPFSVIVADISSLLKWLSWVASSTTLIIMTRLSHFILIVQPLEAMRFVVPGLINETGLTWLFSVRHSTSVFNLLLYVAALCDADHGVSTSFSSAVSREQHCESQWCWHAASIPSNVQSKNRRGDRMWCLCICEYSPALIGSKPRDYYYTEVKIKMTHRHLSLGYWGTLNYQLCELVLKKKQSSTTYAKGRLIV